MKDWLPSDLQPPSLHTFYSSVSIINSMLSPLGRRSLSKVRSPPTRERLLLNVAVIIYYNSRILVIDKNQCPCSVHQGDKES